MIDFPYYLTRISNCHTVCWNVFVHNTTSPYNASSADCDPWQNDSSGAYPAAVFNGDGQSVCATKISIAARLPIRVKSVNQLNWMRRCVYLNVWSYQHIVANGDFIAVYQHAAYIYRHVVAYVYVVAKTAHKFVTNRDIRAYTAKLFFQQRIAFAALAIWSGVITSAPIRRNGFTLNKNLIMAIIPLASHTLF